MAERRVSDHALAKALTTFVETGRELLEIAERESQDGCLQDYIQKKISIERPKSLLGLIEAGAQLYKSISVKKKGDVENLWKSAYQCAEVQDAVESFLQLGVQWDGFLEDLDNKLQLNDRMFSQVPSSICLLAEMPLTDARTGAPLTLGKYLGKGEKVLLVLIRQLSCLLCRIHLKDLQANQALKCGTLKFHYEANISRSKAAEAMGQFREHYCPIQGTTYKGALDAHAVRVVVVSFGCQEGALHWLEETGCHYDMLLDPQRNMYTAFGLGASLMRVLNFNNMLLYAEYILSNYEFPRPLPSIEDDMYQLGGDFVLDDHGKVVYSHCCKSPIDRPTVEEILSAINIESPSTLS